MGLELAILAQNIDVLSLALVRDGHVVNKQESHVPPEQYLQAIDERMREWGASLSELTGVIVVTGPGSFTASRVSTTIANTIGFTRGIPVRGIENPGNLPLEALILSDAATRGSSAFVLPTYNRPPNITSARS